MRGHRVDGQHGDCIGVTDGVSLLLLDLWASFTDHQPAFRASSQLHGHLGGQAADREGDLGRQGEAVLVKGAVYSSRMVYVGVNEGVSLFLDILWASITNHQPIFRASSQPYGHSGRQVAGCDGEQGRQGEAASGQCVRVTVAVCRCGLGQGVSSEQVM